MNVAAKMSYHTVVNCGHFSPALQINETTVHASKQRNITIT